jgi:pimeloyl-ACP methyl ester carboxylesterase
MMTASLFEWIASLLMTPFSWKRNLPLLRPDRIEWNPSLSPRTIRIKDDTLFYVVKGEGEPLLLIHGFGAGGWVWEKQIDVLSQSNRIYVLDLIGHGYSDRPRIGYTPETYIHSVKEFMDGMGIKKATLIGNSMGGGIAWAMAGLFPERAEKLILINCVPPDVLDQVRNLSFRMLAAIIDFPVLPYLVFAGRSRNSVKRILHDCVTDPRRITPEVIDRQYRISRIEGSPWVLYSTFKHAKQAPKLKPRLSRISCPSLLIWGEEDRIFPPVVGEMLQRMIPRSRLRIIKKSGHIPMWETPQEVNEAILEFLKSTSTPSPT